MIIDSRNGCFRATLDDDDAWEGVRVTIWQKTPLERGWKPAYQTTVDAPFHLVRDLVHELIETMQPEVKPGRGVGLDRLRVVSINGKLVG